MAGLKIEGIVKLRSLKSEGLLLCCLLRWFAVSLSPFAVLVNIILCYVTARKTDY